MVVSVNGRDEPLPESGTLAALLRVLSPSTPFAVARNGEFVPRATYAECLLRPGDQIDIVHPMAGG
jgi:sulfur carrier protein